jgi:23S rRNA (uracil1939-C5)-methyltransferase
LKLTIEKLVYGGDGLARLPADEHGRGKAVFVPFTLEGEETEASIIEQRPGFSRANPDAILKPSALRVDAPCPYFQRCGGCHYQHASYGHQLETKAAILRENLRRIAKLELAVELNVHASPPWNYRNRSRLKIRSVPEFAAGYYRFNSHELLPIETCPISSPLINRAISALWELGRGGKIAAEVQEIEIFADSDDARLLIEVYCSTNAGKGEVEVTALEILRDLPGAIGVAAFTIPAGSRVPHPEPLRLFAAGEDSLQYKTRHATYKVSSGSFFQVNRHLTDELVQIVTHGRSGQLALDLYAGVGLFSTVLAESFAQVIAVESSQTSHADLRYSSPRNVKVARALTEQYLEGAGKKLRPDFVVVDPPRSGLGQRVVAALSGLKPPRITYVSCDPATLSRDLASFLGAGYRIEEAHLIDLFPQTFHIESIFHLAR